MAEEAANEVEVLDEGNSAEQTPSPAKPEEKPSEPVEATPAGVAKPATEPVAPTEEQEAFTHIDPKTLSPENLAVYKSLQRDYTKKRQSEAAEIRDIRAKLEQNKSAQVVPQVPNTTGGQDFLSQLGITEEQLSAMSLPEYTAKVLEAAKQGVLIETEQKQIETFENDATVEFLSTDSRLNPEISDSFEPRMATWVGSEMDKAYEKHIEETGSPLGFDAKTKASELIGQWDSWIEDQLKTKLAKTNENAKANAKQFKKTALPGSQSRSTVANAGSLDDAIESAIDEQEQ